MKRSMRAPPISLSLFIAPIIALARSMGLPEVCRVSSGDQNTGNNLAAPVNVITDAPNTCTYDPVNGTGTWTVLTGTSCTVTLAINGAHCQGLYAVANPTINYVWASFDPTNPNPGPGGTDGSNLPGGPDGNTWSETGPYGTITNNVSPSAFFGGYATGSSDIITFTRSAPGPVTLNFFRVNFGQGVTIVQGEPNCQSAGIVNGPHAVTAN